MNRNLCVHSWVVCNANWWVWCKIVKVCGIIDMNFMLVEHFYAGKLRKVCRIFKNYTKNLSKYQNLQNLQFCINKTL